MTNMARQDGHFLNFRVSDQLMEAIDQAAAQSGWDRSKQVRAMLEAAFGLGRRPYIPVPTGTTQDQLNFGNPLRVTPGRMSRRRRTAA
jgi:hypothetical protein